MSQTNTLWLYFLVVFGVVLLPGLDMAFVMGSSLLGGRRSGMAAVGGIIAGGFCHLCMGALGVAVVLQWWPGLFRAMLLGGALYIAWLGWTLLGANSVLLPTPEQQRASESMIFRRAMITSLLNPKAYLFMLAIFPQFLRPGQGPLWVQSGVLGAITALTQAAVYGALAFAASGASGWFERHPGAAVVVARVMGMLLLATALLSAYQAWRMV
ncbi:LysE family translocator [Duganella sp. LX20W]|uniref:LysE family translocator n=1 Tax=Rugamonas brunnea TaxID=2758569 RepID=A0A7W2ETJ5_9BURK|nr:LysE family translocator [Rugamonas brunnea]MBA5638314.1 LysE family translocator [Rugamonas brunnea]